MKIFSTLRAQMTAQDLGQTTDTAAGLKKKVQRLTRAFAFIAVVPDGLMMIFGRGAGEAKADPKIVRGAEESPFVTTRSDSQPRR